MKSYKTPLLTNKIFLIGLFILLINDQYLKYEFSNFLTGKLSDFSGLFIFPFFWSIFFEKYKENIYIITLILFIIWKTPVSTEMIENINRILGTEFNRVVDYTDFMALISLPLSYFYFNKVSCRKEVNSKKIFQFLVISLSLFSFVATSLPRKEFNDKISIGKKYIVEIDKEEILEYRMHPYRKYYKDYEIDISENNYLIQFWVNRKEFISEVKIIELDENRTIIEFVSLHSISITSPLFKEFDEDQIREIENFSREDHIKLFEENVIDIIKTKYKFETSIMYIIPSLESRKKKR